MQLAPPEILTEHRLVATDGRQSKERAAVELAVPTDAPPLCARRDGYSLRAATCGDGGATTAYGS